MTITETSSRCPAPFLIRTKPRHGHRVVIIVRSLFVPDGYTIRASSGGGGRFCFSCVETRLGWLDMMLAVARARAY